MIRSPRVLIFDSGMGGLTVAKAVRELLPLAHLTYAADTAAFPYGAWEEVRLIERILTVMGRLIEAAAPDLVVVACNTASTLALTQLREVHRIPFVGTVPAIKPAAEQTRSGIVGVLATPGTVRREYTQALIHTYAYHCKVFLHGAAKLAEMAEEKLKGIDGRQRRAARRDHAGVPHARRQTHRYDRSGVHALSAADRRDQGGRTVAGGLHRPGARHRAPGRGSVKDPGAVGTEIRAGNRGRCC